MIIFSGVTDSEELKHVPPKEILLRVVLEQDTQDTKWAKLS